MDLHFCFDHTATSRSAKLEYAAIELGEYHILDVWLGRPVPFLSDDDLSIAMSDLRRTVGLRHVVIDSARICFTEDLPKCQRPERGRRWCVPVANGEMFLYAATKGKLVIGASLRPLFQGI
ncbi:MAG: hypothetical protein D6815_08880 [Candidatus Dadabacteria bacterium]|nr:MAG: hypothetical protein D6815_08880 [Candidatus Dadabacteria bacterium]